jgi:HSP20 family molecular chaperone IbpA
MKKYEIFPEFDIYNGSNTFLKDYFEKSQYRNFNKQLQFAGYDKEEVSISYENDYLTVNANSNMLSCHYNKKYYLPSYYYDINNIEVKFEKCILTIDCKLKKDEESKVMKITIK